MLYCVAIMDLFTNGFWLMIVAVIGKFAADSIFLEIPTSTPKSRKFDLKGTKTCCGEVHSMSTGCLTEAIKAEIAMMLVTVETTETTTQTITIHKRTAKIYSINFVKKS